MDPPAFAKIFLPGSKKPRPADRSGCWPGGQSASGISPTPPAMTRGRSGKRSTISRVVNYSRGQSTATVTVSTAYEADTRQVMEWIGQAERWGAGEILVTSVDAEGRQKGMDHELIAAVRQATALPVIAAGGVSGADDIVQAAKEGADAVSAASILHYDKTSVPALKQEILKAGVEVRA